MVSESDRLQLQRYGLIPVYVAAGLITAVLLLILVDRIARCRHAANAEKHQLDPRCASSISMKGASSSSKCTAVGVTTTKDTCAVSVSSPRGYGTVTA